MNLYCNPDWQGVLQKQHLATFDQIWDYPIRWIDAPNENRGGWSDVGCVEILFEGRLVTLFVKKQLNHTTRTLLHPLKGEPTFAKEFKVIQYLKARNVRTPKVVFFGQRRVAEGQQAVLITEKLEGYQALDVLTDYKVTMTVLQQRELLRCIAQAVRRMHRSGMQHRSLYAKHIFVKPNGLSFDVAMIDFEKARLMVFPFMQSVSDLVTLNYRTLGWSAGSRLFFFKQYFGLSALKGGMRLLIRYMYQQTRKKLQK